MGERAVEFVQPPATRSHCCYHSLRVITLLVRAGAAPGVGIRSPSRRCSASSAPLCTAPATHRTAPQPQSQSQSQSHPSPPGVS